MPQRARKGSTTCPQRPPTLVTLDPDPHPPFSRPNVSQWSSPPYPAVSKVLIFPVFSCSFGGSVVWVLGFEAFRRLGIGVRRVPSRNIGTMSGGTPIGGGGYVRQRHSQGSTSGGEDLEDDACSRPAQGRTLPVAYRARTWTQVVENVLWIASAAFIFYFGDRHYNLVFLLCWDSRIKRKALYLGILCVLVNTAIILFSTTSVKSSFRSSEKYALLPSAVPLITIIGVLSFCLFSMALWPIWSFLTLPLLFTLFMAFLVLSPYLSIGPFRPQSLVLHIG